jgi:transglutaminase-like putative cysteine protease
MFRCFNAYYMYYTINHLTRFRYSAPVTESVMEVRMQPLTEGNQRCLQFQLHTQPKARIQSYSDHQGNQVHYFNVPGQHTKLVITAESLVELTQPAPLPDSLPHSAWEDIKLLLNEYAAWDLVQPSHFARPSYELRAFAHEIAVQHGADPLTTLRRLNTAMYYAFGYSPQTTNVDSPIEEALQARKGVCQDFAHIMITIVRDLGIPCRYVSGYLFHRTEDNDRSEPDATHAWVEALLPNLGWVGFDPTNNLIAGERHARTAIGRDYADVPPTRGVYKGGATDNLQVAVRVSPSDAPLNQLPEPVEQELPAAWKAEDALEAEQQQQQQQ